MSELGFPQCRPPRIQAAPGGASGLCQAPLCHLWAGTHPSQCQGPSRPAPSSEPMGIGGPAAACPASAHPLLGSWALPSPAEASRLWLQESGGCRSWGGRSPESLLGASFKGQRAFPVQPGAVLTPGPAAS